MMSFRNKGEIKHFIGKPKLKELIITRFTLQQVFLKALVGKSNESKIIATMLRLKRMYDMKDTNCDIKNKLQGRWCGGISQRYV